MALLSASLLSPVFVVRNQSNYIDKMTLDSPPSSENLKELVAPAKLGESSSLITCSHLRGLTTYLLILVIASLLHLGVRLNFTDSIVIFAQKNQPDFMQVFFPIEGEFSEKNSKRSGLFENPPNDLMFAVPMMPGNYDSVRIDPANESGDVSITKIEIKRLFGTEILSPMDLNSRVKPIQMISKLQATPAGLLINSTGNDPAFSLQLNNPWALPHATAFIIINLLLSFAIFLGVKTSRGESIRAHAMSFIKVGLRRKQFQKYCYLSGFRVQSLFLGIVIGTVASVFLLIELHSLLPQAKIPSAELVIDAYQEYVVPEPTERFVFIILAVLVPIASFALVSASAMPRFLGHLQEVCRRRTVGAVVPLMVAAFLFAPFFGSDFHSILLGMYSEIHYRIYADLIVFYAISLLWCSWETASIPRMRFWPTNRINLFSWLLFTISILLQMLSWRLVGINSVNISGAWSTHADPVFFAVSQVVGGKTLLAELPSQYGMFPEMLAPILRITGLSVLSLSSLFAVMQVVSLVSLFFVLAKLVRIPLLRVVGGISLVVVTFETVMFFAGFDERYFQYWPIRFFWPAISVLAFYWASRKRTLFYSALMSVVAAIGVLWNVDSGLFIVVAYEAFLAARLIVLVLQRPKSNHENRDGAVKLYLSAIVAHMSITIFVILAFFSLLALKTETPLNFPWLFEYQKLFYSLGLMMLPMPRQIDPWMSILGVYLLGMLVSFNSWLHKVGGRRMDMVFYLSMLGLGLFIYYQGRSHVLNLVTVCWPSVMVVAMLTDEYLRAIRAKILPKVQIVLPSVAVSLFFVCCYSFISHSPLMFTGIINLFSTRQASEAPFVIGELAFMRKYGANKHECLILSQRQGIYYAELGLISPLRGPGFVEVLLKADQDRLVEQILHGGVQCIFLGIGEDSKTGLKLDEQKMQDKYLIVATNLQNTMQYLEPRP